MRTIERPAHRLLLAAAVAAGSVALASAPGCRRDAVVGSLRIEAGVIRLGYPEDTPVRFEWAPAGSLDRRPGRPTVFVHLLDRSGRMVRTFDHPFPEPWSPGHLVRYDLELYQSAMGAPLPPGRYLLTAGLYEPSSGYRWMLDAGPEAGRREYRIGTVNVPAADPTASLALEFSGAWSAPEPDGSIQILARRKMRGPASLRVSNGPLDGSLRLALTVVRAPISIESDCGSTSSRELAPGYQWIGIDVSPGGRCEVRFRVPLSPPAGEPKFGGGPTPVSAPPPVSLDIAAWRPRSR